MCGLTAIGHTIADTEDTGLLNICGFDAGAIKVIRNFAMDLIWPFFFIWINKPVHL